MRKSERLATPSGENTEAKVRLFLFKIENSLVEKLAVGGSEQPK